MQEPRRRRRLEFDLLPLACALLFGCASQRPVTESASPAQELAPASGASESAPAESRAAATERSSVGAQLAALGAKAEARAEPKATPPEGTLILHVGDSFAAALGIPLGKRFKQAGMRSVLEFKTASYIPTWAFGEDLPSFVRKYNPDLVLITLGGNEMEIVNPEQRAGAIHRLIKKLDGRPCVWIAPPLWKPDTGLIDVIRKNAAPCRYMDTNTIISSMERGPDKIHPSTPAREAWADAVYAWLLKERLPQGERPWALRSEQ